MNKILKRAKNVFILGVACLAMATRLDHKELSVPIKAAETDIFYEDFDIKPSGDFGLNFDIVDGKGKINSSEVFDVPIPSGKFVASNNYEVSFEIKLDEALGLAPRGEKAHFEIRLEGLDADASYMYFQIRDDGQFWKISAIEPKGTAVVYNNSGDGHGGLNTTNWNLLANTVRVKFVVFEGYLEMWANEQRIAVSHLYNFGNQNYQTRARINEGLITGISIKASRPNEFIIDNLLIVEAFQKSQTYSASVEAGSSTSRKMSNELSAQNLFAPNFRVTTTWKVQANSAGQYMGIRFYGLNGLVGSEKDQYTINAQAQMNNLTLSTSFDYQNNGWKRENGKNIIVALNQEVQIVVEVVDNMMFMYYDDTVVLEKSFTEMGIEKGYLQTIHLINAGSDFVWTSFSYEPIASKILIEADQTSVLVGSDITFTATKLGEEPLAIKWYVDDIEQIETGSIFVLTLEEIGQYTVKAKDGDDTSNVIMVEAYSSRVEIDSIRLLYTNTETALITSEAQNVPEGSTYEWLVNNVKLADESEETLNLDLSKYEAKSTIIVKLRIVFVDENEIESNTLTLYTAYDVKSSIDSNENYTEIYDSAIAIDKTFGTYDVGSDEEGAYLYSTRVADTTSFNLSPIPHSSSSTFSYKVFIPENRTQSNYVYMNLTGLDLNFPAAVVEVALEVGVDELIPYYKHNNGFGRLNNDEYGFGHDLSYSGEIAKAGDWNEFEFAIEDGYMSTYINGVQVLYYFLENAVTPSSYTLNTYPGGSESVNLFLKEIKLFGIVQPAPSVTRVTLSVSAISIKVGETTTITATHAPFDSIAKEIAWYVNDNQVEGDSLTYIFSSNTPGTYTIHCVIDGIESDPKTITVSAANTEEPDNPDGPIDEEGPNSLVLIGSIGGGVLVIGGMVTIILFVTKRKKRI